MLICSLCSFDCGRKLGCCGGCVDWDCECCDTYFLYCLVEKVKVTDHVVNDSAIAVISLLYIGLILTSKFIMKGIRSTSFFFVVSLGVAICHFCPPSPDLHMVMK